MRRTSYFVPRTLEIEAMNEACQAIVGTHDFAPFATSLGGRKNTVRTVYRAMVDREGDLVSCHVQANSFLTHQVRRTMGSLVKVGVGKSNVTEFKDILWSKEPAIAGPTLPGHGLCLLNVNYPGGLQ
jgi:tRNA pseudouridine38-40 synthase